MSDSSTPKTPLLDACSLWERTSAKGHPYLVGRLGGLRVLVMPSRDDTPGGPSHTLLIGQAPPREPHHD